MPRLGAAWVRPTSVDPGDLVNRDTEREKLLGILEDYRATAMETGTASAREARLLISGERGVGKSILTRRVLADFKARHPDQVVAATIDARSLQYRAVLSEIASALVTQVRPQAESHRKELLPLLDYVELLATRSQVQDSQTASIQTKYGVSAGLGTEALVKLTSLFTWERTRQVAATTQATLTVTDSLLHTAIDLLLGELARSPWFVVIFYDDLDQALTGTDSDEILSLFRRVLELRPCIALVHVRTECCVENLNREVTENVEIRGLQAVELAELLRRRLETAPREVKEALGPQANWRAIDQLAELTTNPLVFLRWILGLLRTQDLPTAQGWGTEPALHSLISTAAPVQGFDPKLVARLVAVIDKLGRWFTREALLAAASSKDLSAHDIEDLEKLGLLVPRYRFRPQGELYLEPVFDLLRPSVREKLRG
jgi:hypothetical protein